MTKPNIVIDTSTLVAAARKASFPHQATFYIFRNYNVVQSQETWNELLDVLARPKITGAFGVETIGQLKEYLAQSCAMTENRYHFSPLEADPKDTKFVELAYSSGAGHIISSDSHLLSLKHLSLCHAPTIQVWTPRQFVQTEIARRSARPAKQFKP